MMLLVWFEKSQARNLLKTGLGLGMPFHKEYIFNLALKECPWIKYQVTLDHKILESI